MSPTTTDIDFAFSIGSNIKGFYPHYCNENQQITNDQGLGAFRISYKYGLIKSLITNEDLYTADGSTYADFTINTLNALYPPAGGYGFGLQSVTSLTYRVIDSDNYAAAAGSVYTVSVSSFSLDLDTGQSSDVKFQAILDTGATDYYFSPTAGWTTDSTDLVATIQHNENNVSSLISVQLDELPFDGDLRVALSEAVHTGSNSYQTYFERISINDAQKANSVKGEVFTFERLNTKSSKIEKTKEVFTGDSSLDVYVGTLYKNDGTTPTETWTRDSVTDSVPILEIMGGETMRMGANTTRLFSGDIYGFFDYTSLVTIDGKSGVYGVTQYSYDTKSNIISVEFRQLFGDELTDLSTDKQIDYGNVVEPTIKG